MKTIRKGQEPPSLTEHRCTPGATYNGYMGKDELRECLVRDQGSICCYCMQRIRPSYNGMKIEHWHSQTGYPEEQLDYGNLLGACLGNEGQPRRQQHCDTCKGDRELRRNPADPSHQIEEFIHYLPNGEVEAPNDQGLNQDLREALNLNLPFLVNNRKAVLDQFKALLGRDKPLGRQYLERMLADWSRMNGRELKPYCGVVIYWLKKRLKRVG